jgi:hypothetical protein
VVFLSDLIPILCHIVVKILIDSLPSHVILALNRLSLMSLYSDIALKRSLILGARMWFSLGVRRCLQSFKYFEGG